MLINIFIQVGTSYQVRDINPYIVDISIGPAREVLTYNKCYVNGFCFHTESWSEGRKTNNCGVWVKGTDGGGNETDFFGILKNIVELRYMGEHNKTVVLFMCEWFDPSPRGTRICHRECEIIEVKKGRKYSKYEPFIIAQQARQVYYVQYPGKIPNKKNWLAVIKTKARARVELESSSLDVPYQAEESAQACPVEVDEVRPLLRDETVPPEWVLPVSDEERNFRREDNEEESGGEESLGEESFEESEEESGDEELDEESEEGSEDEESVEESERESDGD